MTCIRRLRRCTEDFTVNDNIAVIGAIVAGFGLLQLFA